MAVHYTCDRCMRVSDAKHGAVPLLELHIRLHKRTERGTMETVRSTNLDLCENCAGLTLAKILEVLKYDKNATR